MAGLPRGWKVKLHGSEIDQRGQPVIRASLGIEWYAWLPLVWSHIRANYEVPLYLWPKVIMLVTWLWFKMSRGTYDH